MSARRLSAVTMMRALAVLTLASALGVGSADALAQTGPVPAAGQDPSLLLLMDSSNSMGKDAGGGTTRLDASKAAVRDVIGALPDDAEVGLRVYGSKVAETTRREGCRDTELVAPVRAGGGPQVVKQIDALQPKGFTPIGRSLRQAAGDFPAGARRKTVVLISDGGDNCAPPPPCRAAREVAKQGVKLSIQVIGLQVSEHVREQLRCIAKAGGGTYVDAGDPKALADELRAAFARARRSYGPTGTPISGGPGRAQATPTREGQYLDAIRPGQERWYSVSVARAQRLWASAIAVPTLELQGGAGFRMEMYDPAGRMVETASSLLDAGRDVSGPIDARAVRGDYVQVAGNSDFARPGRYALRVVLEQGNLDAVELPMELFVQVLDPNEVPRAQARPAQALARTPARPPAKTPGRKPPADSAGRDDASLLAGIGVGGLLLGLGGGWLSSRRRPRSRP